MLGYCKELGVAMEVEVNTSRSTLLQSDKAFGGRPVEQREVINDAQGQVAESPGFRVSAIRQGVTGTKCVAEESAEIDTTKRVPAAQTVILSSKLLPSAGQHWGPRRPSVSQAASRGSNSR